MVGLGRLHHRLVVDGEVVDDVLAVRVLLARAVHPVETVSHDVGDLVGERRVVVDDGRVGEGEQWRVAVGVLETLAGQRGAAGRGADQEAAGQLVGHRPDRVAGALEAEHRVEDVERDHRLAVGRVRRPGRGRRRDAARLGDALVEHLALGGLLVGQQQLAVDGLVGLPGRVVDLGRREHRVHAEGAVLVGRDRHDPLADLGSFIRSLSSRTNAIVVAIACLPDPACSSSYIPSPGRVSGCRGWTRRIGTPPPSARRRSRRYSSSSSPRPGGRTARTRRWS